MRTIFVTSFQPFVSRNILNTGVLDRLLDGNVRIILFVQKEKADFYRSEYGSPRIIIEGIDIRKRGRIDTLSRYVARLLIDTDTERFHKMERLYRSHNYLGYAFERVVTRLLGKSSAVHKTYRIIERGLNRDRRFQAYFDTYAPDRVFSTDAFGIFDTMLVKTAQERGVKSVSMVLSWDNATSKGLLRVLPDRLIVQNEVIREEAERIHSVPQSIIRVSGIAHYEYYKQHLPIDRSTYLRNIGISPERRLVLIAPAGEKFVSTDWHIFEILKRSAREGRFVKDIHFLIRVHPTNKIDFGDFIADDNFTIEEPGRAFSGVRDKDNELDRSSLHHLLDTLAASDVVINTVSSLVIDAAVLDKPVVTIAFNGWNTRTPFARSVEYHLREDNMAKLLKLGGTWVASDGDSLVDGINKYLEHPKEDEEGRRAIVAQQCGVQDGRAAVRVASYVLQD